MCNSGHRPARNKSRRGFLERHFPLRCNAVGKWVLSVGRAGKGSLFGISDNPDTVLCFKCMCGSRSGSFQILKKDPGVPVGETDVSLSPEDKIRSKGLKQASEQTGGPPPPTHTHWLPRVKRVFSIDDQAGKAGRRLVSGSPLLGYLG